VPDVAKELEALYKQSRQTNCGAWRINQRRNKSRNSGLQKKKRIFLLYKLVNIMAPLKGCATHNGKKLPFLFLFCSFLAKLKALAQALQTFDAPLQPLPLGALALSLNADSLKLKKYQKEALIEISKESFS
jgi:hypothetical protein